MALFGLFEKKYTLEMLDEHLRKLRQNGKSDSAYRCKILIIDDKIEDESYPLAEELRLLRDKQTYNLTLKPGQRHQSAQTPHQRISRQEIRHDVRQGNQDQPP